MPFVPDTIDEAKTGRFVPDAPAAPSGPPRLGAAAVPTAEEAAGLPYRPQAASPEAVAAAQRRERAARNPIRDTAVGAVEAALDIAAKVVGGGLGGALGFLGGTFEGAGEKGMAAGAERGVAAMRDVFGTPETETGVGLSEKFDTLMQSLPAAAGVHGTLQTPAGAGAAATRAAGDAGRAAKDAALEAATPRLSPSAVKRVATATEAGIPVSPHQLSGNKFVQMLGETAENIPFAGGGSLRRARREKFSAALAKQMDPTTEATVLDDATFKGLQDSAGERIGDISSKYSVPVDDFGDVAALARRDTPDVQTVVRTFADDVKSIAEQNGGVVPGDMLRKLRTEAQSRARAVRGSKPDLANALDAVVHRFDDALSNNIAEGDTTALLEARRQYAISKTLEPLLAKYPTGDFPPSALKSIVTSTKEGKRRMARGEGGELGEYARLGAEILKEQVSSGTAERNAVYGAVGLGAGAGAAAVNPLAAGALYAGSALYNLLGPRIVKRMVEAQQRREAPARPGPPPEPGLVRGFEDVPQGGAPARPGPLGDLTPEWETSPGAAAAREGGIEPTGLVPAVGEEAPLPQGIPQRPGAQIPLAEDRPLGDLTPDWGTALGAGGVAARAAEPGLVRAVGEQPPTTGLRAALTERAGQQIPAVPGRPGLPDTLVAGGPAEVAATEPANAAMTTPGAIEARRQQGMASVERAAAAERAESVPVGEATEITPQNVRPAPEVPEPPPERIPTGEVTEIKPEVVKPAPEIPEHPEVAKIRASIEKKRAAEAKKQADADALRAAAKAETDPEIKKALAAQADKIAPAKEKGNATGEVGKQEGGQREHPPGDEGGKAAEAGGGNRTERAASSGKAKGEESLDIDLLKLDEAFLDQQPRAKATAEPPPTPRGRRQTRAVLERGIADGTLDRAGASLALWALDRNPNLARGLRVEVAKPTEGQLAKGSYNSATQIVKLFQGSDNPQTAVHEILHHSERMTPPAVQQGIRRAWERALKDEMEKSTPGQRAHFEDLRKAADGDKDAYDRVRAAITSGQFDGRANYHLVNPTEFWAVNGARIMHERFTGRGSWRAQAQQWLREMIEHVKGLAGVRSDSPILKALEEILDPSKTTGERKSPTMIKSGGKTEVPAPRGAAP